MSDRRYLPHMRRSVGSSYLLQQTAGSEMVGGLEVVLRFAASPPGTIRVSNTLWQSDKTRDDIEDYQAEALRGVREYAKDNVMNVELLDIELCKFLVHDVDSKPHVYFFTAQVAFESALAAWKIPFRRS